MVVCPGFGGGLVAEMHLAFGSPAAPAELRIAGAPSGPWTVFSPKRVESGGHGQGLKLA